MPTQVKRTSVGVICPRGRFRVNSNTQYIDCPDKPVLSQQDTHGAMDACFQRASPGQALPRATPRRWSSPASVHRA